MPNDDAPCYWCPMDDAQVVRWHNTRKITFPWCPATMMMMPLNWCPMEGCPSGKVTRYKKIYLALGACRLSQPVNMMPKVDEIDPSTKITMEPFGVWWWARPGRNNGIELTQYMTAWMSNSEYGRKEKRLNLRDIKKLKSWQVIWKSFCLCIAKKVSQPIAKGESIICKSESKILKIAQTKVI